MSSPLIGIIPAAGSGIRARPYTYELHKGMFLIDGKPNIERHIELMRDEMKIEEIVIVLGYMGDTIRNYFGDGSEHNVRIQYVDNQHLDKGWAWSVLLAKPYMAGRNGCVMLADEFYLDSNLGDFADFDLDAYSVALPMKSVTDEALIKKNFSVERDGQRVVRLVENPVALPNDLLGMASFLVRDDVMVELEAAFDTGRTNLDFVTFVDDLIRAGHTVGAFDMDGAYINLNDVASMEAAQGCSNSIAARGPGRITLGIAAETKNGGGRNKMNENGQRVQYGIEDLTVNINTVDRPQYLEACLASLIETTPEGVPLQILFNATPGWIRDRTIDQAKAWRGPTNFIHIDDIVPVDESHNRALESVQTPLVNFMGDDDVVLGNRLPRIIDAFNTLDPEPAVVTTFAKRIAGDAFEPAIGSNKDLGPTTVAAWKTWHESGEAFEMLWPGSVLRTDILRKIGGFEKPFSQSFDNRIFSQMSFHGPVLSLPDREFGFRIHQGSMSSANWQKQNEIVRFVAACQRANIAGDDEPTYEEFVAAEAGEPIHVRTRRQLRDRSRIHFRKGGQLVLSGERMPGAVNIAASMMLWPPAFIEKVRDQVGQRGQ